MFNKFVRFDNDKSAMEGARGYQSSMYTQGDIAALRAPADTIIYKAVGRVVEKPKIEKKQKPLEPGRTYKRVNEAYQDVTIIAKDIDGNFIGRNENKILNIYSPAGRLLEERTRGLVDRGVDTKFDLKVEHDEVEVGTELVIEPVKE